MRGAEHRPESTLTSTFGLVTDDDGAVMERFARSQTRILHSSVARSADMQRAHWAYIVSGDHEVIRFVNRDTVRIKRMICVVGGGWQRLHDV